VRSDTHHDTLAAVFGVLVFVLAAVLTAIWNPPSADTRPRVPVMVNTTVMPDGMMVEWSKQPNVQ
jgi:hypothetical protein